MKIPVTSLPSKGYHYLADVIEMEPLTYSQIMNYSTTVHNNPLDKLMWEIESLLGDVRGYKDFLIYDIKALLVTRKFMSASFGNEIKVSVNGKVTAIDVDKITYKNLPDELKILEAIKIGKYEFPFELPTIGSFLKYGRILSERYPKIDPNLAVVIASLTESEASIYQVMKVVLDAKGEDILTIGYLSELLNNTVNDVTVKDEGGAVISLNDNITDIFQFIRLNSRLDETKIVIKKVL